MKLKNVKMTEPTQRYYADAGKAAEFARGGGARQQCPSCGGQYICVDHGAGIRIWCKNMCGLRVAS